MRKKEGRGGWYRVTSEEVCRKWGEEGVRLGTTLYGKFLRGLHAEVKGSPSGGEGRSQETKCTEITL